MIFDIWYLLSYWVSFHHNHIDSLTSLAACCLSLSPPRWVLTVAVVRSVKLVLRTSGVVVVCGSCYCCFSLMSRIVGFAHAQKYANELCGRVAENDVVSMLTETKTHTYIYLRFMPAKCCCFCCSYVGRGRGLGLFAAYSAGWIGFPLLVILLVGFFFLQFL